MSLQIAIETPPNQIRGPNTTHDCSPPKHFPPNSQSGDDDAPRVTFPEVAYIGPVAEWAGHVTQHYETTKEYLYVDGLAILGAAWSGKVRVDFGDLNSQPRFYVLKIGKSGWGKKSTSTKLARKFFDDVFKRAETAGAKAIPGVASAEGLANELSTNDRVLVVQDEFRRLERKANIEGSVLVPMFCELYDNNDYSNSTKKDILDLRNAHLALIANTTVEAFEKLVNAAEMVDTGFLNRTFVVIGRPTKRIPFPKRPCEEVLHPIRNVLVERVKRAAAAQEEIVLPVTAGAAKMWEDWYANLDLSDETTRLDTMGPRLMAVLALSAGKREVDEEIMSAVLALLEYQRKVRQAYAPITADNPKAELEQKILRVLKRRGPLTRSDLKRKINARRHGLAVFNAVLSGLTAAGDVISVPGRGKEIGRLDVPRQQSGEAAANQ